MPLLNELSNRYPHATALFVKWVTARDLLNPYGPYLRKPLNTLPVEMLYGVMLLFFHENGVAVTEKVSTAGNRRCAIYVKRMTGRYALTHTGRYRKTPAESQVVAITSAFTLIERKLRWALPRTAPDEVEEHLVIGLDMKKILKEEERNVIEA